MITETNLTLIDPRERKRYYFHVNTFRVVITEMIRVLFKAVGTLEVSGLEHLPASGPVVLAANHLTNFDVFPMQLALPRPIYYMGKAELFQNQIMDVALRNMGGFPVYRGLHDEWAMNHAAQVLEHGLMVGIFPEGSRSKGRGMRAAKSGAARLAIEAHCPIVPLAHTGSIDVLKRFPRRTPITITLGTPIFPEPGESILALTDRVMFTIAGMLPEDMRGVYKVHPAGF